MCKVSIVARKKNVIVTQCVNCKILNIWHKGILINFSHQQFDAFLNATKNLNFDQLAELSPEGIGVVVLATPYPDLSLVFNRQEWEQFFAALRETAYMLQIYKLVHS